MMLFYASLGTVLPYLPIFYRKLGLSEQEVGALGAVNPFVTLLLTPIWAALADRYNIQKTVMISTFALSAFSRVGYIYLPPKHAWLTGVLVAWSAVLSAPAKPLLDAAVMQLLRRKSAYGRARLFGQIGFGVGSYISGRFVGNNLRNMAVAHLALAVPTAYAMYRMIPCSEAAISDDAVVAAERKDFALEIKNKFFKMGASRQRELLIFFGAVLAIGIMSGIVENFALNRAIEISAITGVSNHFGMIPLAASLAGAPLFWISGRLISQFGVPALLGASLLSYLIRLLLYAYMTAVWQAIPAEMLRGATFATFWAATTYYVYSIAPERHKATMVINCRNLLF